MTKKENPTALAGADRGIVKTAGPHVSNPQSTTLEALKQDAFTPVSHWKLRDGDIPNAHVIPVILRRGSIALWMPLCPFCPGEHVHGGGAEDLDPHKMLQAMGGYRAPHCGQFGWREERDHERMAGNYRLVWRGGAVQFAPGALSPNGRPTRAAKETAHRLVACGVPVLYRTIGSSIPSKFWRWR